MRLNSVWNWIINSNAGIDERTFLSYEFGSFLTSKKRMLMITSKEYYRGNQDIAHKQRTMVDQNNIEHLLHNVANNIICDNKVDDLVDQKTNYLLGKPLDVQCDDDELKELLDMSFMNQLKSVAREAIKCGVAYLVPYFDEQGQLKFKKLKSENVLPFWRDEEHKELDGFLYCYDIQKYKQDGSTETIHKVEYYSLSGIKYFIWKNGKLLVDTDRDNPEVSHYYDGTSPMNWSKVPLITFKANEEELPILSKVKCLQDALNTLESNWLDNMCEDVRSTILVIKNYDGEDLSKFRHNLAAYGAIKVNTVDGVQGGVETLTIKVDSSNYQVLVNCLKRAIIENGRGFDAKDDRMSNNPNQMNIQSMYSDIDLDAHDMESEFQSALLLLLEFVEEALNKKLEATFIFNRDLPVNQSEVINNCKNSTGLISKRTIVANHPWVRDTDEELDQLQKEEKESLPIDYVDPLHGDEE